MHYAIQYKENGIPTSLQNDGWTKVDKSISWLFLENGKESIKSYPVNDSLHRRLRLHLYICYFFLFFFLPMQFGMFFLLSGGAEFAVLPLVIYGLLVILTIFLFIQHRKSEAQFVKKPNGSLKGRKAIKKIRPGWMYLPYQTKLWLNKMADQGYELHHVGATIFTFVEKRSECVAYEISFEKSVSKEYYMMHRGR